ncbi:germin-like protein 9-3 [Tanacetum coccineum]
MIWKLEITCSLVFAFAMLSIANAGDPDILTDFVAPNNTIIDANYFTFTGMRQLVGGEYPPTFRALKVSMNEFPALNGLGVSYAVLEFPIGSVNPVHIHPRASELMFLVSGCLEVGFVDTTNKLFNQTLKIGDIFLLLLPCECLCQNFEKNMSTVVILVTSVSLYLMEINALKDSRSIDSAVFTEVM